MAKNFDSLRDPKELPTLENQIKDLRIRRIQKSMPEVQSNREHISIKVNGQDSEEKSD